MRTIVESAETAQIDELWHGKGLFTAWAPMTVLEKAASARIDWVALQCSADQAHVQLIDDEIAQVRRAGLHAVVWGVAPCAFPTDADGYIVQIETGDQRDAALELLPTLPVGKPRAIVTTFGGSDSADLVKPLRDHVQLALIECYLPDSPIHGDIGRMLWQAHEYGWPAALPVLGLYHGATVDQYTGFTPSDGFAVWVAEELDDQAWLRLAAL